jgi:hypothetical protein
MAWTTPRCWTTGEVVTAAIMTTHVKDNFNVTAPAVLTTAGDILYASGSNTPARVAKGTNGNIIHQASCAPAWTATPSITSLTLSGDLTVSGGCIVLTGAATDVDLIDNNASALSFDASGQAGILAIVTTNCSEKVTMSGDLEVSGCLTVSGTTTTVSSTVVTIVDPLTIHSFGVTGTPAYDAGFVVERGCSVNVGWFWDESADEFVAVTTNEVGTTAGNVTIAAYADIHGKDLVVGALLDANGTVDADVTDFDVASSGDIDLVSSSDAAAAVYIAQSTGTSGTVKIHADTGTSVTEGAESINILSDVGGIGLRSTANLANAINITNDGGTTGTITIFNDQGTSVTEGAASIALVSDAGGVELRSTANLANAINITNDGGTTGTITIFNDLGSSVTEGAASIELLSDAGGVELRSTANLANAIALTSDGGTTGSILIFNDQGTSVTEGAASIAVVSDAGGVELRSTANLANAINITNDGGSTGSITVFNDQGTSVTEGAASIELLSDAGGVELRSTANLANAINITSDGGTTGSITIFNDQGTTATEGAASIQLLSDVGGIGIKSGLNGAGAIRLTADAGTSETIVLHADQGNGTGSICLTSDAGGITLNPGTFVTVGANATNAAEVRMFEDTDNGCNYVAMKAPNVSTSYTMTWPTAVAGTCGFALKSTTAGVLSWGAVASGGGVPNPFFFA